MEITWAGRWNAEEDSEESVVVDTVSLKALAMKCSDTMKKLKYIFNFLRDLCSLSHIYIYIQSLLQKIYLFKSLLAEEFFYIKET